MSTPEQSQKVKRCRSQSHVARYDLPLSTFSKSVKRHRAEQTTRCKVQQLLDLGSAASLGDLLGDRLGVRLRHAFLDGFRGAVDQILGFLQAQAGHRTHYLDDVDFVGT